MLDVVTMKDFWIILPSLLVPIIAFFLGRFGHYTDRKLEYRTFLGADEVETQSRKSLLKILIA